VPRGSIVISLSPRGITSSRLGLEVASSMPLLSDIQPAKKNRIILKIGKIKHFSSLRPSWIMVSEFFGHCTISDIFASIFKNSLFVQSCLMITYPVS